MRVLDQQEIAVVSGGVDVQVTAPSGGSISAGDGIAYVLGTLAFAATVGAATPVVITVGAASIVALSGLSLIQQTAPGSKEKSGGGCK